MNLLLILLSFAFVRCRFRLMLLYQQVKSCPKCEQKVWRRLAILIQLYLLPLRRSNSIRGRSMKADLEHLVLSLSLSVSVSFSLLSLSLSMSPSPIQLHRGGGANYPKQAGQVWDGQRGREGEMERGQSKMEGERVPWGWADYILIR